MRVAYEMEIDVDVVRVTPRPVWKCRTCAFYGKRPSCPPFVPSWKEAREWVHSYRKALLIKFDIQTDDFEEEKRKVLTYLLQRERELFRKYPYALALFPGARNLCDVCTYEKSGTCPRIQDVRPSLDALGIELTCVVQINFEENCLYSLIFLE